MRDDIHCYQTSLNCSACVTDGTDITGAPEPASVMNQHAVLAWPVLKICSKFCSFGAWETQPASIRGLL